jgi:hypothetical protein
MTISMTPGDSRTLTRRPSAYGMAYSKLIASAVSEFHTHVIWPRSSWGSRTPLLRVIQASGACPWHKARITRQPPSNRGILSKRREQPDMNFENLETVAGMQGLGRSTPHVRIPTLLAIH